MSSREKQGRMFDFSLIQSDRSLPNLWRKRDGIGGCHVKGCLPPRRGSPTYRPAGAFSSQRGGNPVKIDTVTSGAAELRRYRGAGSQDENLSSHQHALDAELFVRTPTLHEAIFSSAWMWLGLTA
ncbi:hypothetical protein GE21DRAFT_4692 [Neurospora crassa]|uniref:Uncharacterized protein n=1 Tax=Neurospora crassa (strain ATCC 24698 / 74-OR23-1A / CBS 708.71 / DSM 1257 / FGSC 987) TaxID=367110 RepID=Q7RYT4_NEUCR|nr:hypothetical protein NCU00375 [Neurospora crassa OR74A]EAA28025.1 hypothetical protein NCU00375 [Neurospora crassa OR74A]KHE87844.1 hypothetical protein GE21DRAFT_4692 [Neurospora crassa]|eukprot:XP_957261.1 hypothetical protein NCU00375 [Neurospora crassa OR74A]